MLAIMIGVAIVGYMMLVQFQRMIPKPSVLTPAEMRENGLTPEDLTPVQRAEDIRDTVEARDRGIFGQ